MKNYCHVVSDISTLKLYLESSEICENAASAKSILIQIFSSQNDQKYIEYIAEAIKNQLPTAILVGSTTVGEIAEGSLLTGTTVLSISFFDTTTINSIALPCLPGDEFHAGQSLIQAINDAGSDVAGVLMFATTQSIDVSVVFKGMSGKAIGFPVFGGGAGVYDRSETGLIFCEGKCFSQGVITIVFLGSDLQIFARTYLGWQPLSKEMTVTDAEGMLVKTVDDICAFDIYHRYLDIQNDQNFFMNVLEFPFLVERDGETLARVPSFVDEHNGIQFVSDLYAGEKIRIGYGDPETMVQNSKAVKKEMSDFEPNAIFLYSCICRRSLMQNDVNLETEPYEAIAPTVGFYTYGEFYCCGDKIQFLNSTIVIVGMREGDKGRGQGKRNNSGLDDPFKSIDIDPYANKHNRIVSQLLHFIRAVSSELEQANKELSELSRIDKLTQISNRLMLDEALQLEISKCKRYHTNLSLILMDIDEFKRVNDLYGHITGDDVMIKTANILKKNVRYSDSVGRWGGDEFLIILPQTNLGQAYLVAEKIRTAINSEIFPVSQPLTCSFGVSSYSEGDNHDTLLSRTDKALYEAKNSGRNRAVFKDIGNARPNSSLN